MTTSFVSINLTTDERDSATSYVSSTSLYIHREASWMLPSALSSAEGSVQEVVNSRLTLFCSKNTSQEWSHGLDEKGRAHNAIIGFGERCEHAAYPPGARGTAPLVRICPTAGCAITGSDARAAAAAGSARPHGARLRPGEVSRGRSPPPWQATARRAPAVSHILGVGGAGRPRRLDGPGAILANCEGS